MTENILNIWATISFSNRIPPHGIGWLTDWLIMSMGWDLRLRTAATIRPIVNPLGWYVSVERHGGDDYDDASWEKLLTRPPELSGNPTSRDTWERRKNRSSENFAYHYLWYVNWSLTCRKILRRGTSGFTSIRLKAFCGFLSPLKIHPLGRVWTRDPWVQRQAC
jgi:hypothetical protein